MKTLYFVECHGWFDTNSEAFLIDDYRPQGMNSGLFSGVKDGKKDEEICCFDEFRTVTIGENAL